MDHLSTCEHCGLAAARGDKYCCYGCELAAEIHADSGDTNANLVSRFTLGLLLSMAVMMLSLFLYAEDVFDVGPDAGLGWLRTIYRWLLLGLSTPVLYLCGLPLAQRAVRLLRKRQLSMDLLIVSASGAAYILSLWSLYAGLPHIYFDSAVGALVLATLGRYLEALARNRASALLAPSLQMVEQGAEVLYDFRDNSLWIEKSPNAIFPGMLLRVGIDRVVPVDIELTVEKVEVNVSIITGETLPVVLQRGQLVPAGAVVVAGLAQGIAIRTARESTLQLLEQLAKSLRAEPVELLRLADRFASYLVPTVWVVAIASGIYWGMVAGVAQGVVISLAVVLAACPCTYGVAAPLVLWLTLRLAVRNGVLIRNAQVVEQLAKVTGVAFDKTGTLTDLDVLTVDVSDGSTVDEVYTLVAGLEKETRHPVGQALLRFVGKVSPAIIRHRRILIGEGISGKDIHGKRVVIRCSDRGETDLILEREGQKLATFTVGEKLYPEAVSAMDYLRDLGLHRVLVTGDRLSRGRAVGEALNIPVFAALSPQEKVNVLRQTPGMLAMVGDGINDAPALAAVGPGFAVHTGSDLSRGIAQITLLQRNLQLVPWTIALSRRAKSTIYQLLGWSTAYNLLFLGLAATGLLLPVWAGVSMLLSSLMSLVFAWRTSGWGAAPALFPERRSVIDGRTDSPINDSHDPPPANITGVRVERRMSEAGDAVLSRDGVLLVDEVLMPK